MSIVGVVVVKRNNGIESITHFIQRRLPDKVWFVRIGVWKYVVSLSKWSGNLKGEFILVLNRINNGVRYVHVSVLKIKVGNLQKRMVVPYRPVSAAAVSTECETHKSSYSLIIF